jgi:hypothetical protein
VGIFNIEVPVGDRGGGSGVGSDQSGRNLQFNTSNIAMH